MDVEATEGIDGNVKNGCAPNAEKVALMSSLLSNWHICRNVRGRGVCIGHVGYLCGLTRSDTEK